MAQVTFRFLKADSVVGRLVTWRLREPWSHVVLIIDDAAYSSQIPFVTMLPITHESVSLPHRDGIDLNVPCTDEEAQAIKDWCESQIGVLYDLYSIAGWIFGFKWLQSKSRSYCFEYCRKPLVHLGWLEPTKDLIKGNRLYAELKALATDRADQLP